MFKFDPIIDEFAVNNVSRSVVVKFTIAVAMFVSIWARVYPLATVNTSLGPLAIIPEIAMFPELVTIHHQLCFLLLKGSLYL